MFEASSGEVPQELAVDESSEQIDEQPQVSVEANLGVSIPPQKVPSKHSFLGYLVFTIIGAVLGSLWFNP